MHMGWYACNLIYQMPYFKYVTFIKLIFLCGFEVHSKFDCLHWQVLGKMCSPCGMEFFYTGVHAENIFQCVHVPHISNDAYILKPEPSTMSSHPCTLWRRQHAIQDGRILNVFKLSMHQDQIIYIGDVLLPAALISPFPKRQQPSLLWLWNITVGTTVFITNLNTCICYVSTFPSI